MKSVQQENEPRRVESILYFSQKSCQKVIFFHFLSYPFYYVVTTLVHHGTTGLARSLIAHCFYLIIFLRPFYKANLILKSFQDWFLAFQFSIVSPLCLHCVFVPWLKTQWACRDMKPEIGNPSEFFLLWVVYAVVILLYTYEQRFLWYLFVAETFKTFRHLRQISALTAQHRRAAGLCQTDFCLRVFFFLAWTKFLSVADSEMSVVSVSLTAPTCLVTITQLWQNLQVRYCWLRWINKVNHISRSIWKPLGSDVMRRCFSFLSADENLINLQGKGNGRKQRRSSF